MRRRYITSLLTPIIFLIFAGMCPTTTLAQSCKCNPCECPPTSCCKPAAEKNNNKKAKEAVPGRKGSFAWGAEAGGSIDMSGNDMSSFDFSASFGYKRGWIKFVGVGAGIDIMVNNSSRSFPIYASFKTNFQNAPSLVFMDIRAGVSVNFLPNNFQQMGAYGYAGLGINLAKGKTFSSHIVIGYAFKQFENIEARSGAFIPLPDIHAASIKLGITF